MFYPPSTNTPSLSLHDALPISPIEPCTAAATGPGGLNVAVTPVSYTSNTNVGTASASATYGGDANHLGSTGTGDRKSTRLNSSHPSISYAVFCLKKKIN